MVSASNLRNSLGDSIVYASGRASNAVLVTGDPDFRKVDGVEFIGA